MNKHDCDVLVALIETIGPPIIRHILANPPRDIEYEPVPYTYYDHTTGTWVTCG